MQDHISQLELVQALSSNNTDLVLASILKLNSVPHTHIPAYGSPLHLVMALCPKHIVIQVIDIFCIAAGATKLARGWVNIRNNPDGQTPLHLASKLCRHDICSRLFDIDGLDDTVCDSLGRNAEELADTDEMLTIFIQQKAALNRACISAIKFIIENWESSPNPHAIKEILTSTPRIRAHLTLGWIDINAPFESEKKQSMLHIFAHLESFEVVDFLLKIGADPDIKDVRGKKPIDTTSSEKIKERLRSAISLASIVSPSITKSLAQPTTVQSIEPPLLKGELLKWTNYTTGYKPRYFILEGGIFSYFQTEQGAPHDCRGSISTLSLTVEFPDAVDHSRFDIRGGGDVRYSLKARSPAESKKWIWALMESQRCMKDIEKSRKTPVPMEVQIEAPMAESFNVLPTLPSSSTHSSQNIATVRSNENRSSPDMNKLFYLLQVQLQVQLEAIETVKSALSEESGNTTNIMNANSILSDTSSLIRETGIKILDAHNLREQSWQGKLDKEIQARKRWEDIIQKMIAEKPAEEPLVQQELPEYHGDTTDDEVFYDAAGGEDDFIDTAFGYERFSESRGDTPTPTGFTKETSGTARTFITDQDIHDVSCCYEFEKRTSLPLDPKASRPKLAIWSFLKSAIGKDLSKIPLPVMFNEPSSMLQRMCEDVEYVELLSLAGAVAMPTKSFSSAAIKAAASLDIDIVNLVALTTEEQEYLALMLVAAFAMSNYSSTPVDNEKGYRYLSEQVCHHPPISACQCESSDFIFWSEINVKSRFAGMCLELHPAGYCHVLLPTDDGKGRHFSWKKVTTKVNNLILGPLSLDHTGTMIIKDHTSTSQCRLEFEANAGGWFASGSSLGRIRGDVTDHSNAVRFQLEGNWMERLTCKSTLPCSALLQNLQLWKRNPFPECSSSNFNFTNFTMSLNQCPENLARSLPPTDSRLRPDQKAMEAGLWKDADTLKEQVETYQRIKREQIFADFALTGLPIGPEPQGIRIGEEWWVPRWFTREFDPDTKSETWKFKGDYWDIRKAQVGWPPYVYDIFCEPDK